MSLVPYIFARNKLNPHSLIGMKEVALRTGLSYWYVRALACGSEKSRQPFPSPATKIGRRPLWLREEIDSWMQSRKKSNT